MVVITLLHQLVEQPKLVKTTLKWCEKMYIPKNKGWNKDPNTWSGKFYIPTKHINYCLYKNPLEKLFLC